MVLRCLATMALALSPSVALAAPNLDTSSRHWDGLSELVALAETAGHPLEIPREVAIDRLTRADALLLLHPTTDLPVPEITAFLRRGGRMAVVDDLGSGDRLLDAFQISREPVLDDATTLKLRDNPQLLIAQPTGAHPLTRDVRALVTNHPQGLRHAALEPVFTIGGTALILAGAVGEGRLVAVADSSVLINNMLALPGNQRFARNLLDYLREGHPGRLVLAVGATPLSTPLRDRLNAPLDALRVVLARMSKVVLPPGLVAFLAVAVCGFVFLWVASLTRLRSPYAGMSLFARAPTMAGFAGRVAYFRAHPQDLTQPLIAFKIELEAELRHRLSLPAHIASHELAAALGRQGAASDLTARASRLFAELEEIAQQEERGTAGPVIDAQRFRDAVRSGERILADVARQESR
jgi:hypothetical protein